MIVEKIDKAINQGAKTIVLTPLDFQKWAVARFNTYPDTETNIPYVAYLKPYGAIIFIRTLDVPEGDFYTNKSDLKRWSD